jgi:hypothetical protein
VQPRLEVVVELVDAPANVERSLLLGGSGLLASVGLIGIVEESDVQTDATDSTVHGVLGTKALPTVDHTSATPPYAGRGLFTIVAATRRSMSQSDSRRVIMSSGRRTAHPRSRPLAARSDG